MRIQIIGHSGSGKSTLARRLAELYQIPCLHLDNIHFYGNWQERPNDEMARLVRDFMQVHDRWVIDGNYTDVAPERFTQCDLTIFLDFSRLYCYRKCRERYLKNLGHARECCPCEESFDFNFRRWILWDGRTKERRRQLEAAFYASAGEKLLFRSNSELVCWLQNQKVKKV